MFVLHFPGPKVGLIRNGTQKVFIDMQGKRKTNFEAGSSSESKVKGEISSNNKDTMAWRSTQEKPQLVIINRENSAFSKHRHTSLDGETNNSVNMKSPNLKRSNTLKEAKKRRIVVSSDGDSDDLDFGGGENRSESKKHRLSTDTPTNSEQDLAGGNEKGDYSASVDNGVAIATKSSTSSRDVLFVSDSDDDFMM